MFSIWTDQRAGKRRSQAVRLLFLLVGSVALLASACSSTSGSSTGNQLALATATDTVPLFSPNPTATAPRSNPPTPTTPPPPPRATPTATIPIFQPQPTATPTPPTAPDISGSYQGSYTVNGQSGTYSMQVQFTQSGTQVTGTTTEGSSTASDSGTIDSTGNFTINESFSGGGTATLYGSIAGPGHLTGTWTGGGGTGTWDVTAV
jgi:hypothetical protein